MPQKAKLVLTRLAFTFATAAGLETKGTAGLTGRALKSHCSTALFREGNLYLH